MQSTNINNNTASEEVLEISSRPMSRELQGADPEADGIPPDLSNGANITDRAFELWKKTGAAEGARDLGPTLVNGLVRPATNLEWVVLVVINTFGVFWRFFTSLKHLFPNGQLKVQFCNYKIGLQII
jgi:hypothetical protein